jgi:hypothetical protein
LAGKVLCVGKLDMTHGKALLLVRNLGVLSENRGDRRC